MEITECNVFKKEGIAFFFIATDSTVRSTKPVVEYAMVCRIGTGCWTSCLLDSLLLHLLRKAACSPTQQFFGWTC